MLKVILMSHFPSQTIVIEANSENLSEMMSKNCFLLLFCVGFNKIAELLIKAGIDLNSKRSDRTTAIHLSAMLGNMKISELLVNANAKLNEIDKSGRTPMERSFHDNGHSFLAMLKRNGKELVDERFIVNDIAELIAAVEKGIYSYKEIE